MGRSAFHDVQEQKPGKMTRKEQLVFPSSLFILSHYNFLLGSKKEEGDKVFHRKVV